MRASLLRRFTNRLMLGLALLCALLTLLPLFLVLSYLLAKGASSLSVSFFTHMPKPVGEAGGGMANAMVGTLIILAVAALLGVPVGVGAGVYLAEHKASSIASSVRLTADVLGGVPSIVMGAFAWQLLVRPVGHFSALAGGLALGVMMVPTVARTTEEMVLTVPLPLRNAALALGAAQWQASLRVVLPTAMAGIVTGIMVAMARVAGETAPLLFTAFGNQFWSTSLRQPIAALPLTVFNYAISAYEEWHRLAWAGALVLIFLVFVIGIFARFAARQRHIEQ